MAITVGSRLGPYEIVAPLGAGGMGEVYRARDTKLNRDVAIKVLLSSVANDADRLSRFGREAQLLAALNHPNIAHIHGLEESDGVRALVMELVEGPTLADRIAQGALPVDEALPIARQIAEALEAAHAQGIIHRDLKPANIKVRADGTVKVLDFGLAKALDPLSASSTDATISPTLSIHATQSGVILGTAAYMSPEQARGKVVDARTDVWAFGCVLFEMLSGKRAFRGDDVTDTIVAVVSKDPDWPTLPPPAARVQPLLARCLRKDPRQRLQSIGDARIHLDEVIGGTSDSLLSSGATTTRSDRRVIPLVAALACGAAVAALATWALTRPAIQNPALPVRFEIVPPQALPLSSAAQYRDIAISPDGQYIVYVAGPQAQLVVRAIDRLDGDPLPGIVNAHIPFFSPDGQSIGYFEGTTLKRVAITGGAPVTVAQFTPPARGASWGSDGTIVFTTYTSGGLLRVPAAGGEPAVLTTPDGSKAGSNHWYPSMLPGGGGVLFTITAPNQAETAQVAVLDLRTRQQKTLIRGSQPEYVASGHLVYAAANTLRAVRFDLDRLEVLSDPVVVVDDLSMSGGGVANYAVSHTGTLVHVPDATRRPRTLVWVDRQGRETPIEAPALAYQNPRLSPDASRVAVVVRDRENDIQVLDLKQGTLMRLASNPSAESNPIWTPDGLRIVFSSARDGGPNLYSVAADGTGTAQRLTSGPYQHIAWWVAPDGSGILGSQMSPTTVSDIVWFPMRRPADSPQSPTTATLPLEDVVATRSIEYSPAVSPNGRYMAYSSQASGRAEIYVRPFPRVNDSEWRVSSRGGVRPVWSTNGRELFYLDPSDSLTAVSVDTTGPRFSFGNPTRLFEIESAEPTLRDFDVAPDGRFLMVKPAATGNPRRPGMIVAVNWLEELKAKVP